MFKLSNETKIGLLFIAALGIAVWGFKFLKGINILQSNQTFFVKYKNVSQLQPSAPVTISGLQVGIVGDIKLDRTDDKTIIVELNINGDVDIPKNTIAQIVGMSIMGGKAIALNIPQPCAKGDCAVSGSELIGTELPFIESIIGSPDQLDVYTEKLKLGLTSVYDSIANPDDPKGIGRSLVAMQEALVNLSLMTAKINRLLDASTSSITATTKNAETITKALASNQQNLTDALGNVKTLSQQMVNANFDQQANKAGVALDSVTASLSTLRITLQQMQGTVGETTSLVKKLNSGEGSVGQLLTDDQLYENLSNSIAHFELLVQDLRMNPKRYNTVKLKLFGNKRPPYEAPSADPAFKMYRDSLKLLKQ